MRNALAWAAGPILDYYRLRTSKPHPDAIAILEPAVYSTNLGDHIIAEACRRELEEALPGRRVLYGATQDSMSMRAASFLSICSDIYVCGSNLLSSRHVFDRQWPVSLASFALPRRVVTFGVGLRGSERPNRAAKAWLNRILSRRRTHSVRDSRAEAFLRNAGFENVLNTACPTMWRLTPEKLTRVPSGKAERCVFTLTDYDRDPASDVALLDILCESYSEITFFPQGWRDIDYLRTIRREKHARIVEGSPSLRAFDEILMRGDVDYVGTRLHGGIRALQHGARAIILSVDERASQIALDTNLPVLSRKAAERIREAIHSELEFDIRLPVENIERWKAEAARTEARLCSL